MFVNKKWWFICLGITIIVSGLLPGYSQERRPDVIYVPTPMEVVREMLNMAQVTKDDVVYDLGCGDGRIVVTAAKEYGARGIGVDVDSRRIQESNDNVQKSGVADRVKILQQDIFQLPVQEASVVTLYLLPRLNLQLRPKFFRELRPGTRIVSHDFDMSDWRPDKSSQVSFHRVFFWVVPAQIAGLWRWSLPNWMGEPSSTMALQQRFQEVEGKVNIQGKDAALLDPVLSGTQFQFRLRKDVQGQETDIYFSGKVHSETIEGSAEIKTGPLTGRQNWTARLEQRFPEPPNTDHDHEPNDSRDKADAINGRVLPVTIEGTMSNAGDVDWFEVSNLPNEPLRFVITHAQGVDFDFEVYSDTSIVGRATAISSGDSVTSHVAGRCYLRVWSCGGYGHYNIQIEQTILPPQSLVTRRGGAKSTQPMPSVEAKEKSAQLMPPPEPKAEPAQPPASTSPVPLMADREVRQDEEAESADRDDKSAPGDALAFNGRALRKAGADTGRSTGSKEELAISEKPGTPKIGVPKVWKQSQVRTNAARVSVGNQEFLQLRALRVMVKVEGMRARTIVDHVFFNPYERQLQGTFDYRLPDQASICYFAFAPDLKQPTDVRIGDPSVALPALPQPNASQIYTMPVEEMLKQEQTAFGELKVARVVPREKALLAYEETVRGNIDPALIEWAGGNTFSTRVFPLRPRSFQRVIIAYEQTLPKIEGQNRYEFFFPAAKGINVAFSLVSSRGYGTRENFNFDVRPSCSDDWTVYQFESASENLQAEHAEYLSVAPEQEVIGGADRASQSDYIYARLAPQLPSVATGSGANEAIFLLDTSLSQEPDEFGISLKALQKILELNPEIQRFNILFFNVETRWAEPRGWLANTPQSRQEALNKINKVILEGATDIEAALAALNRTPWLNQEGKHVDIFFLSNGQGTWGDPVLNRILAKFKKSLRCSPRFFCYNFGLGGVNQDLFHLLTSLGGSVFSCPQESQLNEVALAHKQAAFALSKVETTGLADVLLSHDSTAIYPGQEILLAAKATAAEAAIVFQGTFQGESKSLPFPLKPLVKGNLAPRAFGEMAVRKMESRDEPALEKAIVAFARYFAVPGKTCSLLMLERPQDYERFKIDVTTDSQSVRQCEVSKELDNLATALNASLESSKSQFVSFWERLQQSPVVQLQNIGRIARLIPHLTKNDFEFPDKEIACKLYWREQLPQDYLAALRQHSKDYNHYLQEGERRYRLSFLGDYIRCVSSLVELEPNNTGALRMVGYSFLQKKIPEEAIGLFGRVRDLRPFEPHSYRDLAKCYAALGKYGAAAAYYEIVLAGDWHQRFGMLKTVVQDEYLRMIRQMLQKKTAPKGQIDFVANRLEELCSDPTYRQQADIVVTMSWNTDNTDVDLWVTEPNGEQCGYSHRQTSLGGRLLEDITRGYGPERYWMLRAFPGKYRVAVHYYSADRTKLSDRTFVDVTVTTKAGYPDEASQSMLLLLNNSGERQFVTEFTWPPSKH